MPGISVKRSRGNDYGDISAVVRFICAVLAAGTSCVGDLSYCVVDSAPFSDRRDRRRRSACLNLDDRNSADSHLAKALECRAEF